MYVELTTNCMITRSTVQDLARDCGWEIIHSGNNNFDQMLTFDCFLFGHFVQEANEIMYPCGVILALPVIQM